VVHDCPAPGSWAIASGDRCGFGTRGIDGLAGAESQPGGRMEQWEEVLER